MSLPQMISFLASESSMREDAGKWFDLDSHRSPGFFQKIFVGMREQQNRFFGVIDHSVGQAGLVVDQQRDTVFARDILCLDDGELVPGNAISEMNAANSPAGNRAANRDAVQHVGKCQVVDVAAQLR